MNKKNHVTAIRALFHISGSVSVSALRMRIKKRNKLNNVGAILVVRISIRINFVRIQVRIESVSERFYPHADDIRTTISKISR